MFSCAAKNTCQIINFMASPKSYFRSRLPFATIGCTVAVANPLCTMSECITSIRLSNLMPNNGSKREKVCIKNACVGYLLVLQEGDSRRYISYKQFRPIPYLISCARVTGRWVLLSHTQNAVRWLTLNLEPSLSVPDFVFQLDKSRKESLGFEAIWPYPKGQYVVFN